MKQSNRSCIACRRVEAKSDLLRIVLSSIGEPVLDVEAKQTGRGAYVHPRIACVLKLSNLKIWGHAFKKLSEKNPTGSFRVVTKESVASLIEKLSHHCLALK